MAKRGAALALERLKSQVEEMGDALIKARDMPQAATVDAEKARGERDAAAHKVASRQTVVDRLSQEKQDLAVKLEIATRRDEALCEAIQDLHLIVKAERAHAARFARQLRALREMAELLIPDSTYSDDMGPDESMPGETLLRDGMPF